MLRRALILPLTLPLLGVVSCGGADMATLTSAQSTLSVAERESRTNLNFLLNETLYSLQTTAHTILGGLRGVGEREEWLLLSGKHLAGPFKDAKSKASLAFKKEISDTYKVLTDTEIDNPNPGLTGKMQVSVATLAAAVNPNPLGGNGYPGTRQGVLTNEEINGMLGRLIGELKGHISWLSTSLTRSFKPLLEAAKLSSLELTNYNAILSEGDVNQVINSNSDLAAYVGEVASIEGGLDASERRILLEWVANTNLLNDLESKPNYLKNLIVILAARLRDIEERTKNLELIKLARERDVALPKDLVASFDSNFRSLGKDIATFKELGQEVEGISRLSGSAVDNYNEVTNLFEKLGGKGLAERVVSSGRDKVTVGFLIEKALKTTANNLVIFAYGYDQQGGNRPNIFALTHQDSILLSSYKPELSNLTSLLYNQMSVTSLRGELSITNYYLKNALAQLGAELPSSIRAVKAASKAVQEAIKGLKERAEVTSGEGIYKGLDGLAEDLDGLLKGVNRMSKLAGGVDHHTTNHSGKLTLLDRLPSRLTLLLLRLVSQKEREVNSLVK